MLPKTAAISGVILAGGKSSRMGTDKALLKLGPYYVIERIADTLKTMVDEVVIVTDRPRMYAKYGDIAVSDIMPGHGPLGGLHAGLVQASRPWVLVTACDLPFISVPVARLMMQYAADYDAVVPRYRGYVEPLYAMYNKSCLEVVEQHLVLGQRKIDRLYDEIKVKYLEKKEMQFVEPHLERAFLNLNTPRDWTEAQACSVGL